MKANQTKPEALATERCPAPAGASLLRSGTMTATQTRRMARYAKLLKTLRRTEALLIESEVPDGGVALERTRQNIATVEALDKAHHGAR